MAANPLAYFEAFHNKGRYRDFYQLVLDYHRCEAFSIDSENNTIRSWNPSAGQLNWNEATQDVEEEPYWEETRTFLEFYIEMFQNEIDKALAVVGENAREDRGSYTMGCIKSFFREIKDSGVSQTHQPYYVALLDVIGRVATKGCYYLSGEEAKEIRQIIDKIGQTITETGYPVSFNPAYEVVVEGEKSATSGDVTKGYGVKLKEGMTAEGFWAELKKHRFVGKKTRLESFKKIILSEEEVSEEHKIIWVRKTPRNEKEISIRSLIFFIHKMISPDKVGVMATDIEYKKAEVFFRKPENETIKIDSSKVSRYKEKMKNEPNYENELLRIVEKFTSPPSK